MTVMMDQNGISHAVPHDLLTCHTMCRLGTVRSLALSEDEDCPSEPDCRYCIKAIRDGAEPDEHEEFEIKCGYCSTLIKPGENGEWIDQRGDKGHYVEYWAHHSPDGEKDNA